MSKYKKLRQEQREIRILHIRPGAWDDEIQCTLQIASLDTSPVYQTLSYVWGDPSVTLPILLNGHAFEVTANLFSALKRLRCAERQRVIWVDALCINQEDVEERNEQVGMMGAIYTKCTDVVAWLGDTSWKGQCTIEEGETLYQPYLEAGYFSNSTKRKLYLLDENRDMLQAFTALETAASGKHVQEILDTIRDNNQGLLTIFKAAYWTRIWIIQELLLPPSATVYYGPIGFNLDVFFRATNQFNIHENTCCIPKPFAWDGYDHLRRTLRIDLRLAIYYLDIPRKLLQEGSYVTLPFLLQTFSTKKSTDPRDKVYGLLGLINYWNDLQPLLPDYRTTLRETLENTSLSNLKVEPRLGALPTDCMINAGLPSWIADWSKTYTRSDEREIVHHAVESCYFTASVSTGFEDIVFESVPNSLLLLKASLFDKVDEVTPYMSMIDDFGITDDRGSELTKKELIKLRTRVAQKCKYLGFEKSTPSLREEVLENVWWRTVCGDIGMTNLYGAERRADVNGEHRNNYEMWYKIYIQDNNYSSEAENASARSFHRSVSANIQNRRFFFTEKGYVGVGPKRMQVGDLVYVINGSNIPHILRKVSSADMTDMGSYEHCQIFRTVGNCYVHGIMDGEACEQRGGEKATEILLC